MVLWDPVRFGIDLDLGCPMLYSGLIDHLDDQRMARKSRQFYAEHWKKNQETVNDFIILGDGIKI